MKLTVKDFRIFSMNAAAAVKKFRNFFIAEFIEEIFKKFLLLNSLKKKNSTFKKNKKGVTERGKQLNNFSRKIRRWLILGRYRGPARALCPLSLFPEKKKNREKNDCLF